MVWRTSSVTMMTTLLRSGRFWTTRQLKNQLARESIVIRLEIPTSKTIEMLCFTAQITRQILQYYNVLVASPAQSGPRAHPGQATSYPTTMDTSNSDPRASMDDRHA